MNTSVILLELWRWPFISTEDIFRIPKSTHLAGGAVGEQRRWGSSCFPMATTILPDRFVALCISRDIQGSSVTVNKVLKLHLTVQLYLSVRRLRHAHRSCGSSRIEFRTMWLIMCRSTPSTAVQGENTKLSATCVALAPGQAVVRLRG